MVVHVQGIVAMYSMMLLLFTGVCFLVDHVIMSCTSHSHYVGIMGT